LFINGGGIGIHNIIILQNYLYVHYIQALVGGISVPDWIFGGLINIVPLIEKYQGHWQISPHTIQSQEIQVIESLYWKINLVTNTLHREEFTLDAWTATIDILELFGRAHPEDRFPDGQLDSLRITWFVLIRNAAVSSCPNLPIPLANMT
jgi:hypothetical protein